MSPHFKYEIDLWEIGRLYIGGIDEVGRGAFAGPVFSACVGFALGATVPSDVDIKDSKVLTQKKREVAYGWIKEHSLFCAVGISTVEEIYTLGVNASVEMAACRAVKNAENNLGVRIHHLLIDAISLRGIPHLSGENQTSLIKGDSISMSIAAASIVAKVERDKMMCEMSEDVRYQNYKWNLNKGYGTKAHRDALVNYGITKMHRKQFVDTFMKRHITKSK